MKKTCKSLFVFLVFFLLSCETWMSNDESFFKEIDEEVRVAKAEKIDVYLRYAVTTQGTTTPSDSNVFKVDVESDISCVTNTSYGFHHWAAFPNDFFDIKGQNKNILYESIAPVDVDRGYNYSFLQNELYKDTEGNEIISFYDRFSPSTTVTVHQKRDDIVLVPVVAARPTIDRHSPTLNQSGVVRNTSLRYLFTKKMDLASFNVDNIKIKSDYSVMTDNESNTAADITSKFIWSNPETGAYSPVQSETGKMITFRLRQDDVLDSNRQITIDFSNSIRDADNYEMETDQRLYFTTGTSIDSLAPIIQELKCGVGDKFATFDSIHFNGDEIKGEDDKIKSIYDEVFDPHLENRVQNKINIYLYATDISGAGENASVSNVDEDAVYFYGIRARLLYDSNGNPSDAQIEAVDNAYVPRGNDITTKTTDEMNGRGYAFSYDLSSLPDGLIAIDVWAMDYVGNNGLDEPYYDIYDNGYRTLLVVKDTSAPNAFEEKNKVISKSDEAIYGWYNASTLSKTYVMVGDNQKIIDYGHERLRSKEDGIKWIFTVGDDPTKWTPSAADAGWRNVTDGAYDLGGINVEREGPIGILMALMDEGGNMSETVILSNTVLSDLTKPQISAMSWVDANGNPARTVSNTGELSQYLKVPFTENLSGVREITIEVDSATGIQQGKTKFYYNSISVESEIQHSISSRNGKTCVVLTPQSDKSGYESGTIFIGGINIGEFFADGNKTANVVLYDAALNDSPSASASVTYDKTAPLVQNIVVNEVAVNRGRKWLTTNAFTGVTPNNASVTVTAVETTAGVEFIALTGAKLTSNSKLYAGSSASGTEIPCVMNETTGIISLEYSQNPVLKNADTITFTISGIEFTSNIDNGLPNNIAVQLTDFAGNIYGDIIIDTVYIDSKPPAAPTVKIYDSGTAFGDTNNYWQWSETRESFTDTDIVYLEVSITGNEREESGITTLSFSNVQFDENTQVSLDATASESLIRFREVLDGNATITISGARILEANKNVVIGVSTIDLAGWTSANGNDSILHDSIKPGFGGKAPAWLSVNGENDGITDDFDQEKAEKKQKLSIPYSETGSGVKLITIDGAMADKVTSVMDGDRLLAKGTDYTLGKHDGKDYIVFAKPLVSSDGTVYIEGLSVINTFIGTDPRIDVTVSLYDAAENNDASASGNKATICIDETPPVITRAVLPNIQRIQDYGDGTNVYHYYIGNSDLQTDTTDVILYITEATSGIKTLEFTGSIKPTSLSTITLNDTPISNFTVENGVITFSKIFEICDASRQDFALKITDCHIETIKTAAGESDINNISVTATDFVDQHTAAPLTKATYTDGDEYTAILASKLPSAVPAIALRDRERSDYPVEVTRTGGMTNSTTVNSTITITPSASTNSARGIRITSGGSFITSGADETKIYVGSSTEPLVNGTDYTITTNAITFTRTFSSAVTLTVNNIRFGDGVNGTKTVSITTFAPTAISSDAGSGSIILDTAAPTFGSGTLTWLAVSSDNVDGITDRTDQSTATTKQKLRVPYSETLTGLKLITITGASTSKVSAVANGETTLAKGTDYTLGENHITFTTPLVSEDGTIYIEGLVLENEQPGDAEYKVSVQLYDTSINTNAAHQDTKAVICIDTTAPILAKAEIKEIKRIKNYEDGDSGNWNYFIESGDLDTNALTVTLTVTEATSGIRTLNFSSGEIKPTDATAIRMTAGGATTEITDFTVSGGIITFKDSLFNKVKSSESFTLEITNCALTNIKKASGESETNIISVTATDFAGIPTAAPLTKATYTDSDEYTAIIANKLPSAVPAIALRDRERSNYPVEVTRTGGMTNETTVNSTITITPTTGTNSAQKIKIASGGSFITSGTDETKIYVGSSTEPLAKGTDYAITADTITFTRTFTNAVTLTVNNITLTGSTNGTRTISLTASAPTTITSDEGSGSIILDTAAPTFGSGTLTWLAVSSDNVDGITDGTDQSIAATKQKLRVPYSETLTGLKLITITGASTSKVTAVANGETTLAKGTDYTLGENHITFTTPLTAEDGTIYIEGLVL